MMKRVAREVILILLLLMFVIFSMGTWMAVKVVYETEEANVSEREQESENESIELMPQDLQQENQTGYEK